MIDSHCHLDVAVFDDDRAAMLARAATAGVTGMLVPAIRPDTWTALAAMLGRHPAAPLAIALGVHPQIVPELTDGEHTAIADLTAAIATARTPATVAVGECGLDGGTGERARQEQIFRAHIRAARELRLPLVVHVRRAHDTAASILRDERAAEVGGVMHSYSGPPDLIPIYRELGFAFSFAGAVTRASARKPLAAAAAVPDELLLCETDAPDQTPGPGGEAGGRGRNEPAHLAEIIAALARIRGRSVAEVAASTAANARRIFSAWAGSAPR